MEPMAQKNDENAIDRGMCDFVKKYEIKSVAIFYERGKWFKIGNLK